MVLLPISDYKERVVGRRLVSSISFVTSDGVKVFCNQSKPSQMLPRDISSSLRSSPLGKLPIELRLRIMEFIFEDVKPDDWLSAHYHAGATPASVIFASKLLYFEGRDMALKACTFNYVELPDICRLVAHDRDIYDGDPKIRLYASFNEKYACEKVYYD
ncbi:MAG: hypothetical protein Q9180_002658 [Flavoplaca navasiana]